MIQDDTVHLLIICLLNQHICQHGYDGSLAVRHDIDDIVTGFLRLADLNNQISEALSGKKLVNPVGVFIDGVSVIPVIHMQ